MGDGPATTVVHISDVDRDDPDVEYIGRPMPRQRLKGSVWANPWRIGAPHPDTGEPMTRDDSVGLYRTRTLPRLLDDPANRQSLVALSGKKLACWCAGRDGLPKIMTADNPFVPGCHGQVVAAAADTDD